MTRPLSVVIDRKHILYSGNYSIFLSVDGTYITTAVAFVAYRWTGTAAIVLMLCNCPNR